MKLWHDDVRAAPEGWVRVRTNTEAMRFLRQRTEPDGAMIVTECSLDHDLGAEDAEELEPGSDEWWAAMATAGRGFETGLDLVHWMCKEGNVPDKVTIHSWNPAGAIHMAAVLNRYGHDAIIAPYQL